jgi:hypothetical protein
MSDSGLVSRMVRCDCGVHIDRHHRHLHSCLPTWQDDHGSNLTRCDGCRVWHPVNQYGEANPYWHECDSRVVLSPQRRSQDCAQVA